jgi:uncharacterized protein (DUF427 family)
MVIKYWEGKESINMMPRVLQQVMFANNECAHRVLNKPHDSDSLIHSFHALHHAVNVLRDGAVIADSTSRMETTTSIVSECMPSPISLLHCTSNQQSQQHRGQPAIKMEATNYLQFDCPSGAGDPTSTSVFENCIDTFYICDRMILFQNPYVKINEGDELTMVLISSTLLFNFAVICNRYGMQHSDSKRMLLLQRASKVYYIVIEMLVHTIMTSPATTTACPNYNDGVFHQVGNIELLLTLVYNNLGLTYYQMSMYAEYNECMAKLNDVIGNQNVIFDLIRPNCFADIIEEIKLNAIYWKSFAPSPIALAA